MCHRAQWYVQGTVGSTTERSPAAMPIVSAPHGPMTRSLDCTESERDGGLEMEGEIEGEREG